MTLPHHDPDYNWNDEGLFCGPASPGEQEQFATVWHEGSRSFYRAKLLRKLSHAEFIEEGDSAAGDPTVASTGELPPLPEPIGDWLAGAKAHSADQMHAYARQAIEQAGSERLTDDARRWQWWRQWWRTLCTYQVARAVGLDLHQVYVTSPGQMDAVTDAAIRQQSAEGCKASKTIVTNGDEVEVVHADGDGVVRRVD